ncbi:hepatitis A virus cellular receptor 2 homolog isoform X2 [Vombatus ursinus]|uniref:hepatitis A virus cellular receptor 2 homolog isoform X2 n=1 Tax=Vombatus ursinus TaxID=29139 RepID=UPI000FFD9A57|nr:hepatitis A virus cellular receptor 2 homolog isoform X2 [Vombatus ursinus]
MATLSLLFPLVFFHEISAGAMLLHLFIFVLLLRPTEPSVGTYTGVVGQTVLLPCSYVVNPRNKTVPICWGKGACPLSRCTEEFLTTDGWKVTHQKIKRYKLKGDLFRGNVSLTIENVGEADSGIYCCRIEFKGLLNDQKTSLKLVVKPAETTTFRLQPQQTSRNTQSNNPIGYDFTTEDSFSGITEILEITSTANELQKSGDATRIGIYIGVSIFMVLVLALALGTFILKNS